jgi:transcriptional regulator with XRE-family HTH domain
MNQMDDGLLWIDEQMRLLGINKAELARRGGFDAAALTNVQSGRRKVGRRLAQSIARGLGIEDVVVWRKFGLMEESEKSDEEAIQLSKLLHDIEDKDERQKAVGIVTAVLRQIAHGVRARKGQSDRENTAIPTGKRSKA